MQKHLTETGVWLLFRQVFFFTSILLKFCVCNLICNRSLDLLLFTAFTTSLNYTLERSEASKKVSDYIASKLFISIKL